MSGERCRVAIVGAGLAGLYAHHLLRQHGVHDALLLEARPRIGGRILSVNADAAGGDPACRLDLGPTWFWPTLQPELSQLLDDLGLPRFAQHDNGHALLEHPGQPPQRIRGYAQAEPSLRLLGGLAALTDRLAADIPKHQQRLGHRVQALHLGADGVVVTGTHPADPDPAAPGRPLCVADQVLLALPPRLAAGLHVAPALPAALQRAWQDTGTWMAPHAKYLPVFEQPFWRDQGLSGAAQSRQGPMVEIHDASVPGGPAALFGFIGVPAQARARVSEATLRAHCRAQLVRLFGPQAAQARSEHLKDWAQDPFTATTADREEPPHRAPAPPSTAASGPWQQRMVGVGSEWSPQFPGYVAGAVDAARRGVQALLGSARQAVGPGEGA